MNTVVFIGHNECYDLSSTALHQTIIQCIENGATQFLSGGQGGFDRLCASTVYELKKQYPHIKNILVIPYLSFHIFCKEYFDEIILPNKIENCPYKAAIPQRNRYMVEHTDTAVCYIQHSWGNAAKTYALAEKRALTILQLAR